MKALINGSSKGAVIQKGADIVVTVTVFNDDGSTLAITAGQIDLVVYDRSDRANAAIATHSTDTLVDAAAGYAAVAIADTEITYAPGDYIVFVRYTTSGSSVYLSQGATLTVK